MRRRKKKKKNNKEKQQERKLRQKKKGQEERKSSDQTTVRRNSVIYRDGARKIMPQSLKPLVRTIRKTPPVGRGGGWGWRGEIEPFVRIGHFYLE